jgi:hypothetical protein
MSRWATNQAIARDIVLQLKRLGARRWAWHVTPCAKCGGGVPLWWVDRDGRRRAPDKILLRRHLTFGHRKAVETEWERRAAA